MLLYFYWPTWFCSAGNRPLTTVAVDGITRDYTEPLKHVVVDFVLPYKSASYPFKIGGRDVHDRILPNDPLTVFGRSIIFHLTMFYFQFQIKGLESFREPILFKNNNYSPDDRIRY